MCRICPTDIMCSPPTRKLSFRIDDILQINKEDKPDLDQNKNKEKPENRIIRTSVLGGEHASFRPYPSTNLHKPELSYCDSFKSNDIHYNKKPEERDYLYSGLNKSLLGYHPRYPCHTNRLHLPTPTNYLDTYAAAFNNVVENPHWTMMPSGYLGYGMGGCSTLGYPSYLRTIPLSSLAKRKGGQVRFTPQQTQNLERRFGSHKYLSPEDRRLLAGQLKLSDRQVKTWFQNRRAKWRRANNITTPEGEDIESDNQSDEEQTQSKNNQQIFRSTSTSKNSPIFVG